MTQPIKTEGEGRGRGTMNTKENAGKRKIPLMTLCVCKNDEMVKLYMTKSIKL